MLKNKGAIAIVFIRYMTWEEIFATDLGCGAGCLVKFIPTGTIRKLDAILSKYQHSLKVVPFPLARGGLKETCYAVEIEIERWFQQPSRLGVG